MERCPDGSLAGRFNKAQHGGCRTVPLQCQTGRKTKCSFTSCGYSRDRDVLRADELDRDDRARHQYLGLVPERLLPVRVETWGPIVFINLDAASRPLAHELGDLGAALGCDLGGLAYAPGDWIQSRANWKLLGRAFEHFASSVMSAKDSKAGSLFAGIGEENRSYALVTTSHRGSAWPVQPAAALPRLPGCAKWADDRIAFCWVFPNLLLAVTARYVAGVVLQPLAMDECLQRVFLLVAPGAAADGPVAVLRQDCLEAFGGMGTRAARTQQELQAWGSPARPDTVGRCPPAETQPNAYRFQRYLLGRLLAEHGYHWNAPLYGQARR